MNSFVPNWFVSIEFHARSSTAAVRARPDTVEPVVSGHEVAAGIADDGHAGFLDLASHVGTRSFCVSERRPGLEHSGVDRASEVLEECAQHPAIEVGASRRCRRNTRAGPRVARSRSPAATAGLRQTPPRCPCRRGTSVGQMNSYRPERHEITANPSCGTRRRGVSQLVPISRECAARMPANTQ